MKFGKIDTIENVDFRLPPDASGTIQALEKNHSTAANRHLYIGCTGWGMKEWVGKYYPPGAKTADYLKFYGQQFNTIELNTTHYRIPDQKTVEKWQQETPDDFRFCPKLPQIISHSNDLGFGAETTLLFAESVHHLFEKLGCCFIQLPPYMGPEKLPVIERFFKHFPNHIPLALELRHEAWFTDGAAFEALCSLMEAYQIAPVLTDVAGRRDVLHMRLTTDTVLIRFVGNGLHPSDYSRINSWAERLSVWFDLGLKSLYFFCHEPDNLLSPELAQYAYKQFSKIKDVHSRGPKLIQPKIEQMRLF